MDAPVDLALAAEAAVSITGPAPAGRPGRLVELHLVDLPGAAPAVQEGQLDLPTDERTGPGAAVARLNVRQPGPRIG